MKRWTMKLGICFCICGFLGTVSLMESWSGASNIVTRDVWMTGIGIILIAIAAQNKKY